eukprot:TRINITY_DN1004_c0_g1_i13.p1 TRINITY_DN1004_c0_g1~~TRINITY_DN1004_c0_g1_i13.p1  ORF type:complete len:1810 (-),score=847.82 TRINITY_DN1004_c0_g1_i13:335-5695(-)
MAWRAQSPGGKGAAAPRWPSPGAGKPVPAATWGKGGAAPVAKPSSVWQPAWKTAAASTAGKGAPVPAAITGKFASAPKGGKSLVAATYGGKAAASAAGKSGPGGKAAGAAGGAAAMKAKEAKDSAEFKTLLAAVTKEVSAAEGVVEALGKRAAATSSNPPKAEEALEKVLGAIETSAQDAQKKVEAARSDISSKMATIKSYAPEAQKQARTDLQALQQKMSAAGQKLAPLKKFKTEFTKIADIKKALAEAGEKLQEQESNATKAEGLVKGDIDDEKLTEIDELLMSVQKVVGPTRTTINQKSKAGGDVVKPEVEKLQKRIEALTKKVEGVNNKIKGQKAEKAATEWAEKAEEHAAKCEASMNKCQDAEMPFLKGMEVLPKEESDEALAESDAASKECTADIGKAKTYLRMRTAELKGFPKDIAESITEQLKPIQARLDKVDTKLQNFKKETAERKVAALLAEAHESVADAEKAAEALEKDSKALSGDDATVEALKAAITKSNEGIQEASKAIHAAKKVVGQKQREAGKSQGSSAPLQKIQARVSACDSKVGKAKNVIQNAEKLIKVKTVLESEGKKLDEIEGELKKVVDAVPAEGAAMGEEQVKAMDEGAAGVSKSLGGLGAAISGVMGGASASSKEALQKLLDRKSDAQSKLQELKKSNKERREKVLSGAYVKEAQACAAALEAGTAALAKAELPYLKGIEVLPLSETKEVLEVSEKASKETQEAIQKLKNFLQQKGHEVRGFSGDHSKVYTDGVAGLKDKVSEAEATLRTFNKDTEGRAKTARIQEAEEMVKDLEAESKKVEAALEPFKKEGDAALKEDAALEPLQKFLAAEKEYKSKTATTRNFVNARRNDAKGHKEQQELIGKLSAKIGELSKELSKNREPVVPHEQRHMGKMMVVEAKEKVATLAGELKNAKDACEPLLEEEGVKFLVDTSIRTLAKGLKAHMKEKELTVEAYFKDISGGKVMSKADFMKYLTGLPESIGREELAFTDERKDAIFHRLDANQGGKLSGDEFALIFRDVMVCHREVSLTSKFELTGEGAETICKLESGEQVEVIGEEKSGEHGLLRRECKVVSSGKTGWVTKRQGKNSYMHFLIPYKNFCHKMDAALNASHSNIMQVNSFVHKKIKETGHSKEGPLATAREELKKIEEEVKKAITDCEELTKKVAVAKKDWQNTERAELNAHIDAKNKAAAEEFVKPAKAPAEAAEKEAKKIAAAAKEFLALDAEGVLAFKKPSELVAKLEGLLSAATEKAGEARKVMTEQTKVAKEAHKEKVDAAKEKSETPPSNGGVQEVQAQFQGLTKAIDDEMKAGRKALADCRAKVNSIVAKYTADVKTAIRKAASAKGNVEKLYLSLANKKDKVSTADMAKFLQTLDCLKGKAEHATLVASNIQKDGVSKYRFLTYAQLYYKVLKDIAFTDSLNLESCKTLRKAEQGELVELIEGPVTDEKSGVKRIKASSMIDNVSGWMTVQGNQGTPFLEESQKLYFSAKKEQAMEDKSEVGSKELRKVMEDEVFELVEGPSKVTGGDILRAKVKTSKDQITGWVTIKDGSGTVICKDTAEMTIKQSIALTDGQDAKTSKVLRKLEVGEKLQVTGELIEDKETGTSRVKCKALKDNKEGWVTTKGNKSTVYADVTSKTYTVVKEVQMQTQFKTGSPNGKRKLEAGETMTVLEGPKEEKAQTLERVKVRALSDSKIGWISRTDALCKRWSPVYRVSQPAPLQKARSPAACEGIEPVRELTKGEALDVVEGPVCEDGVMRVRGMAVKDGEAGWVTIKGTDGKRYLD